MPASASPAISVITPVFNGIPLVERAIRSVRRQTFLDWELLLVDDASTDASFEVMTQLAGQDSRIRVLKRSHNGGPSAARNEALPQARGEMIAYLDQDDEFYPDYLSWVHQHRQRADVLVFAYDLLEERPDHPAFGTISIWNPQAVLHLLRWQNIAVPLGVAHHRALLDRAGLFHEQILVEHDWDLWKRFASLGARFLYLPQRSGLYHVRPTSLSRIVASSPARAQPEGKPRILFASYHCYLDPSSGAALATRDLLELLAARGWSCGVVCGPALDFEGGGALTQVLADQRVSVSRLPGPGQQGSSVVYNLVRDGVPVTVYAPAGVPRPPGPEQGDAFLRLFDEVAERFQPDVLLSYGGGWPMAALLRRARQRGLAVVFALHNFAYTDVSVFQDVDAVLVPSRFAAEHYQKTLGLRCTVLPGLCRLERSHCDRIEPRYATFVNPQPDKGLWWFAGMAQELARQRPDISLLVVEGRGRAEALAELGLQGLSNLSRMANTPDPRDFYRVSRLVLMPSLWCESFGRVAVEALDNGLPVLASRRGALPETLAGAGLLLDIPEQYTPHSRLLPSAAEVAPWVEALARLWDDTSYYEAMRQRCLAASQSCQPEMLLPRYESFFQQQTVTRRR